MKPFILVIFLLVGIILLSGCLSVESPSKPRVCFGERCVLVEVARTPEERSRGLMYRESLPPTSGMLFVFEEENVYGFWMKNTRIPLDAIWLDGNGSVVDVITMYPCQKDPCKVYTPSGSALMVLEINAGLAKQWNIVRGASSYMVGV